MMKMLIQLDEEKIKRDNQFNSTELWEMIDKKFIPTCKKEVQLNGAVLYSGDPKLDYFTKISLAYAILSKNERFAKYCIKWIWYDNDDNEELPFQDLDVLARERTDNPLFA